MKRAALYARVSTNGQLENSSPDAQLARCREYCEQHNYSIVKEAIESISGSFVLARSTFNGFLDMAAEGELDVIVVDIPDRLGRGDAIAKLELLAQLNNTSIEYAAPGRDTTTIEGMALKATDQLVSGIERMNIRRRTLGGKRAWAEKGRVIASSFRPFGYKFLSKYDERGRKISCTLEIVETEAQTVRLMFDLCVIEQLSVNAIARRLTDMQIPTPRIKQQKFRRFDGIWRVCTVHRMLTNRTYMGEWQFGKRLIERRDTPEGIKRKCLALNRKDAIGVNVPAIISPELWHDAQLKIKENVNKFRKPTTHVYLLRGRLTCALCGHSYRGVGGANERGKYYRYYKCRQNHAEFAHHRCNGAAIRAELIESITWDVVSDALQDERRLFAGLAEMRAEAERARRNVKGLLIANESQIQKAREKLARYLDLYSEGELSKDEYKAKKQEVNDLIAKCEAERGEIEKRLGQSQVLEPPQEQELRALRAEIVKRLDWGTPEQRAKLYEMLFLKCFYNSQTGEVSVTGIVGKHVRTLNTASTYARQYASLAFCVTIIIKDGQVVRQANGFKTELAGGA